MSCAEFSLLGSDDAKRRLLAAALVCALPVDEVDHSLLSVFTAELSLLGSCDSKRRSLNAARLLALVFEDTHPDLGVSRTELLLFCPWYAKRRCLVAVPVRAPLVFNVDHPVFRVFLAALWIPTPR